MKFNKKVILNYLLCFLIITSGIIIIKISYVQGQIEELIGATVKISVCGDLVAEGAEECDNTDLNGQTCETLGYSGGILVCDIACDFDTSGCFVLPTPTQTPTLTLSPTPTLTPTPDIETTSSPQATSTQAPISPTKTKVINIIQKKVLPSVISFFDWDGSGKIDINEVYDVMKSWVSEWREDMIEELAMIKDKDYKKKLGRNCDIDLNGVCNLKDLSILLFYVGR